MQHPTNDADVLAMMAAAGDKPICAKFSAEWCGPCKRIVPDMEALATETGDKMVFMHIDVDKCGDSSTKWGIEAMPTLKIIKNGE